jgi:hypothetical protein
VLGDLLRRELLGHCGCVRRRGAMGVGSRVCGDKLWLGALVVCRRYGSEGEVV